MYKKILFALITVIAGGLFAAALSFATMDAVPVAPVAPVQQPVPVAPPPVIVEKIALAEPVEVIEEEIVDEDEISEIIEKSKKDETKKTVRKGKWVLIDKSEFELTLFDGDKVINSWGVALGRNPGQKQKKGDNKTPNGVFTVQQIQDASAWTHDFRDGKGVIKGAYGPWFIRLKTPPFTGIGIHGTHDPSSIGKLASEGCIRLQNENVRELKKHVTVGMTVEIRE